MKWKRWFEWKKKERKKNLLSIYFENKNNKYMKEPVTKENKNSNKQI